MINEGFKEREKSQSKKAIAGTKGTGNHTSSWLFFHHQKFSVRPRLGRMGNWFTRLLRKRSK